MQKEIERAQMGKAYKKNVDEGAYIAPGAIVIGDVTIGKDCSIWFHSTVRADREPIVIGDRSNVQDNAVLHVEDGFPVVIGRDVVIGHGAIIHGCEIEDGTMVGMGAIVLNGAKIGKHCIIGAGALVTQNSIIPDNSLVLGSPGKVKREVTEEEIKEHEHNVAAYVRHGKEYKEVEAKEVEAKEVDTKVK